MRADVAAWLKENGLDLPTLADTSAQQLAELFADLGVPIKLKLQLKKAVRALG